MRNPEIGELLDGRYEVLELIGQGGMGRVYRARQVKLDRIIALKVPSAAVMADEGFVRRFEREAMTVARFHHDNIVMIHDVFVGHDMAYLSMEFVDGLPLDRFLTQAYWELTTGDLVGILHQCCDGLQAAHDQGVIHRDIKPANIFVTRADRRVKIMDFGIARMSDATMLTQAGTVMGTPQYMSPEQIRGQAVGPGSDIYAMSVLAFQLLTMTQLFEGETTTLIYKHIHESPPPARSRNPRLAPGIDDVMMKGLAKDPADRFAKATNLGVAIEQALAPQWAMPYHQLVPLSREQLVAFGIPTTPPPSRGATQIATVMATAAQAAAAPPPRAPVAPPPPVAPAAPIHQAGGTHAMRTAGHTATQIGHATTLITKAATQRLAIPAAKSGGRALGKLLLLPFRLLAKVSPKAQVTIVVLAAFGVGGFLYRDTISQMFHRGTQAITPARDSSPSSPSSPSAPQVAQPAQPTPPSLGWSQSPPTRFNRLQMNVVRFAFLARPGEPDRRVSHYMVSIDGGTPERVEQPRSGHATWGPLPRGLPGGQHTIQVVAYDDRGTASTPITATFSTPALAEEIIDNAPRPSGPMAPGAP